jgi:hypothetical protein
MTSSKITTDDIEKMRALVNQHDAAAVAFDINNPPKVQVRFQEFPKLMYKAVNGKVQHQPANNKAEQEEAEENGWQTQPILDGDVDIDPELDAASQRELRDTETKLEEARKKEAAKKAKKQEPGN